MEFESFCPGCGRNLDLPHYSDCPTFKRNDPRITREAMFFEICEVIRKRSSCKRGQVGCVIVQDNRVVSMGYNGSPPGAPHCFELGCDVEESNHEAGCQRAIHAEVNAVSFAARAGVRLEGGTLYCTHSPCLKCAQVLLSAGISGVHYLTPYRRTEGHDLLRDAGVPLQQWSE